MKEVCIIGAGASGLFAANFLKTRDFVLLEHNTIAGKKISISGGGKCNFTNKRLSTKNYFSYQNAPQLPSILKGFDNKELLGWIKAHNCHPLLRKKSQYFCPHSAKEMVTLLTKKITHHILPQRTVKGVKKDHNGFLVITDKEEIRAKTVLVASGGVSYKKIGASPIGYDIARYFGHTLTPIKPALVGLTVQKGQFWFKELSGVSLLAKVKVGSKSFLDNILFTHKGISGPAILNASLYWERGEIELSFLEKIPKLDPKKQISSQLPLPKRFVKRFLEHLKIEDKSVRTLSEKEREKLKKFTKYSFAPAGTFGFERAEVTKGGVVMEELDTSLQSKFVQGLFFCGEVLDVTGELGGYNFQWAFSSGYKAAEGINEYLRNY